MCGPDTARRVHQLHKPAKVCFSSTPLIMNNTASLPILLNVHSQVPNFQMTLAHQSYSKTSLWHHQTGEYCSSTRYHLVPLEWFRCQPVHRSSSIFNLTAAFKADTHPSKVNPGVCAYRDNNNMPRVLPAVKKVPCRCRPFLTCQPAQATEMLLNNLALDPEYLPFTGLPEFTNVAARLILGPQSPTVNDGRVVRSVALTCPCHTSL